MVCTRASSALVLSIFFSAVAPWHILHLPLNIAAASSSVAVRAGTETKSAAAISGIPIKAAAIFFIIAVAFPPNYSLSDPQERFGFRQPLCRGSSVEKHYIAVLRLCSFSHSFWKIHAKSGQSSEKSRTGYRCGRSSQSEEPAILQSLTLWDESLRERYAAAFL